MEKNVDNNSIEFQQFLKYQEDYKDLKPYRTEWMIYDEELKLAGSIDMVNENSDGTLQIRDWKRSKQIVRNKSSGFVIRSSRKLFIIKYIK